MRARVNTARVEPGQIDKLAAAKALLPRAKPQTLASNAPSCWAIAARVLAGADARVAVIDRAMSTLVLRPAAGAALQPQEVGR
jgi:hypothetical protein